MKLKILPLIVFLFLGGCSKDPSTVNSNNNSNNNIVNITATVSNIREDSALVTGTINLSDGSTITESGICFSVNHNPTIAGSKIVNTVSSGSYSCQLSGLNSKSVYYLRTYYTNSAGTYYGTEISFTSSWYAVVVGNYFFNDPISALCADASGNIYASGWFTWDGSHNYVAKYDGSTWSQAGTMLSGNPIRTLCTSPSGEVICDVNNENTGESFTMKLSGNTWNYLGTYGVTNFWMTQTCTDLAGNTYAVGSLTNSGGNYFVTKWAPNGNASQLGNFNDILTAVCADAAGNVYVSGNINNSGHFYIAKWDGTNWSQVGDFNDVVQTLAIDASGNLLAAGSFGDTNNKCNVAKWDGSSWSEIGNTNLAYNNSGTNSISKMVYDKYTGNIYLAGDFKNAAGRYYILKWDGANWSEFADFNDRISAICVTSNGKVYAAGNFKEASGHPFVALCN